MINFVTFHSAQK